MTRGSNNPQQQTLALHGNSPQSLLELSRARAHEITPLYPHFVRITKYTLIFTLANSPIVYTKYKTINTDVEIL